MRTPASGSRKNSAFIRPGDTPIVALGVVEPVADRADEEDLVQQAPGVPTGSSAHTLR